MTNADDAAAYVLGTLRARERRRFEARMKKSPELRSMVRALEVGSIGLAMAAPRREPPVRIWDGIHRAVVHDCEKRHRARTRRWLRSAAAIAACAVVGWFAYRSWDHRASTASPGVIAANDVSADAEKATDAAKPLARAMSQKSTASNLVSEPPRERQALRPTENATLRERVGDLENQVAHLAQTVNQQQPMPADFNRLTFVNIVPEGADATISQMSAPSPELRRALLLGVARQLGWMPHATPPSSTPLPSSTPPPTDPNPPAPQNELGVQFVDLPPVETPSPESQLPPVETPSPAPPPVSAATAPEETSAGDPISIPAFVSGTNMVFAMPPGTGSVNIYSANLFYGTVPLGNGPTVVNLPIQARAFDNSVPSQASPGPVRFSTWSAGSVRTFVFTFPIPPSTSP